MLMNIINRSLKIGSFFYTPPLSDMKLYETDISTDIKELSIHKISITGNRKNYVYVDSKFKNSADIMLKFKGSGNIVIFGKSITGNSYLKLNVDFYKNNSTLIVSDMHHLPIRLSIMSYDDDQMIIWGKGSTSNGTVIACQFPQSIVAIGDDCMFAAETNMRNSDMHGLYDLSNGRKINSYGNMIIQSHVWIGQYVYLLGNVLIGYGSVVGVQSLVKGMIEPCCVYAGTPVRKIRENVSWDRSSAEFISEKTKFFLNIYKNKLHEN